MYPGLRHGRKAPECMRVGVSEHEADLEEQEARAPDSGGSAKPRQDLFSDERLDQEDEKGSKKRREPKGEHGHPLPLSAFVLKAFMTILTVN